MAKALDAAGFDVTVATDADQTSMTKAIDAFGAKLKAKGGVGLFYFSGHGAQISGENYLIPVSVADAEEIESGATETLKPVATAAADEVSPPEGNYRVEGRNAQGEDYSGTVTITKTAKVFQLSWKVGDSEYEGDGALEGNLLTVDWGGSTPIVYALADDGSLTGLWDGGHGEETLTPEQ
jgi:hypothetical protein